MKTLLKQWRSDKLKTAVTLFWLLTVFFGFFGSTIFLVKVPGLPALYPFRVLLPVTTLLYLVWAVREKRNIWKLASFAQRVCYVLCVILIVYGTLSLFTAVDYEFTFTLWITLCFNLVFFALALELCSDRKLFTWTLYCALAVTLIHMVMGFIEIFRGGFFTTRFYEVFFFLGRNLTSPAVSAGNPNDYSMMLVFMMALVLLYWAWRGHDEKLNWVPVVMIPPVYFLLGASYARLCTLAFWIIVAAFAMYTLTSGKLVRKVLIPVVLLLAATVAFVAYGDDLQRMSRPAQQETAVAEMVMDIPEEMVPAADHLPVAVPEEEPVMETSGAVRIDLLLHAWNCFKESRGMGVGLGNTAQLAKATAARRGGVWAIHCFLARMTADFGIWFLIPLLLIAYQMLQSGVKYVLRERKKGSRPGVMIGVLYLACILIYPIASTAPGDAQNSMPMWLFLSSLVLFPALARENGDV